MKVPVLSSGKMTSYQLWTPNAQVAHRLARIRVQHAQNRLNRIFRLNAVQYLESKNKAHFHHV